MKERLSKALASAGIAARRKCDALIFEGRVEVNGEVAATPAIKVDLAVDRVKVDGRRVKQRGKRVYYLLHKPLGALCTNGPGRKRVIDLFPSSKERLFTVGRLDKDTSGLLLVTNDGDFAQAVIHPSNQLQKEYIAKVAQEITHQHLVTMSEGCQVEGVHVTPVKVAKIRKGTVRLVITDGKKHEVRHLLAHAGLNVRALARVRIGNLRLGNLPPGAYRSLTKEERESLFE